MNPRIHGLFWVSAALLLGAGCATTGPGDYHQFSPMPQASVGAEELQPIQPRTAMELLLDAQEAFEAANAAQESGDKEAALRHYTLMLELLIEADLDPSVFYGMRDHFTTILDGSQQQATVYERRPKPSISQEDVEQLQGFSALQIPFPLPERVLSEIDRIQNGYPDHFQRYLDRSYKYLPYIYEEFEEAGLPRELAYVALVESGFQPKIVSRAGAGGMWQFMKPAARRFDLRVDAYVDERYNWKSSTRAAIDYLKVLYSEFEGNWPLAISAYNMGEGGLARAMESNGGDTDLWRLLETPPASNRIRLETKRYYPKFIASLIVAGNPERYGFKRNPQSPEETTTVTVKGSYALAELDRALGYSAGTMAQLNPDLVQETTPPTNDYTLSIPLQDSTRLASVLSSLPTVKYGNGVHKVRKGETVTQIASRYGILPNDLMRANSIRSAKRLRVGQELKIPGAESTARGGRPNPEPAPEAQPDPDAEARAEDQGDAGSSEDTATPDTTPAEPKTYTVKRGDTLFDIAQAHKVSINDLQKWNRLSKKSQIKIGQNIVVGEGREAASAPVKLAKQTDAPSMQYHTVRAGEYPAQIARAYGISLEEFLSLNQLGKRSTIRVGDTLLVAASSEKETVPNTLTASIAPVAVPDPEPEPAAEPEPEKITHEVKSGESIGKIAAKYGVSQADFMKWNKLTAKTTIRPGDKFTVLQEENVKLAKNTPAEKKLPEKAPAAKKQTDKAEKAPAEAKESTLTHTVLRGQNPTTIAQRYGVKIADLFKWNGWPNKHVLQVGDKVIIYAKN
ncbi:MAG: LysM peptidoglycan-binding domain-containing protein [Candidatus Hydrogenedentes bacterium]|nr:LysM peptidoglycan-binding domain-containing protein [Candidatus Hydrogenedentota bacterium]